MKKAGVHISVLMKRYLLLTDVRFWILFVLLWGSNIHFNAVCGQISFQEIDYIPVSEGTGFLEYPWAGGLNSAQFCNPDLNGDGIRDLLVYEKTEDRVLTFISDGNGNFELNRAFSKYIPQINGWVITKDMNCDGIDELFTYYNGSVMVYEGYRDDDTLKFRLWSDGIYYKGSSGMINLYSTFIDRPAIVDIDFDGDLDILTFDVSDSRILWYKNQRIEKGLDCDTLVFTLKDNCWGNIYETELEPLVKLRDTCSYKLLTGKVNQQNTDSFSRLRHAGSTLEAFDMRGRGVMDMLIGDVTFNFLNHLRNDGDRAYASVLAQDTSFPAYDVPINLSSFPLAVFIDVDNDGKKDLLVSPFEGLGVDNYENVWWYKNKGKDSVQLELQTKSFLVGEMIDVGENAVPTFLDVDGDGKKDLLISGTMSVLDKKTHHVRYYKNVGTSDYPVFQLEDGDFLNFSELSIRDSYGNWVDLGEPYVHAGDLDGDGKKDILIGVRGGAVLFYKNISSESGFVSGNPQLLQWNEKTLDIGLNAAPFVADINQNGRMNLLLGTFNGHIVLYENMAPKGEINLEWRTDSVGKLSSATQFIPFGYSAVSVADIDGDGKNDLILGGFNNYLRYVSNIEDSIFTQTHPQEFYSMPEMIGKRIAPTFGHTTAQKEGTLLLGLLAGGVRWFSIHPPPEQSVGIRNRLSHSVEFAVYPNPNSGFAEIFIPVESKSLSWQLADISGKTIRSGYIDGTYTRLDMSSLPRGVYVFTLWKSGNLGGTRLLIKSE